MLAKVSGLVAAACAALAPCYDAIEHLAAGNAGDHGPISLMRARGDGGGALLLLIDDPLLGKARGVVDGLH